MNENRLDGHYVDEFEADIREAGKNIARTLGETVLPAADSITRAFRDAGRSVGSSLEEGALSGSLSFKKLVSSLRQDLQRIAVDTFVRDPVRNILTDLFSAPFSGSRAGGGFTAPGNAYLVGENGPEIFTPSSSGRISAQASPPVNVSISLPGVQDAEGFYRSRTQIAAALARSLSRGQRNM